MTTAQGLNARGREPRAPFTFRFPSDGRLSVQLRQGVVADKM